MPQKKDYIFHIIEALKDRQLALLLLLTVLPEELKNNDLRLGENRRNEVVDEFEKTCPAVLDVIQGKGVKFIHQIIFFQFIN
jgi:hypothetical protein